MDKVLKNDREHTDDVLAAAQEVALRHLKVQDKISPGIYVSNLPMESVPENGIGAEKVIRLFEERFGTQISGSAGPRYFGFVTGGSTPAALAADWLVSAFDQNACGSNDSIAPQIEMQTIHFMKEMFGLGAEFFGSFVTGATMSNFVSLAIARQWAGEQQDVDISLEGTANTTIRVVSATPHSSVLKSMSMLGIGKNALIKIDTLPDREAIDVSKLEALLRSTDNPVIVVANAGTVNTVDFDDLFEIGKLKSKYKFWFHVDAAFGGFAALSGKHKHLVQGIEQADSITIDAHKWLNVPYDAAMQFTRHRQLQLKVFQNSAAYLGDPESSPDFFHYTPENSRRWRALPSWFTLMAYGKSGHREIVERNCASASRLGGALDSSNYFRLLAPVRMNVVCFTFNDTNLSFETIQQFLARVRDDGRVFFTPTIYKGTPAIRAAISNWKTTNDDIDVALSVLEEVYHLTSGERLVGK